MATKVIKGSDGFKQVEVEIAKTLKEVKVVTMQGLENAIDQTAKEVVTRTKGKSPVRTGVYKKGWSSKKERMRQGAYGRTVYNAKKPHLTHLLEHGHFERARNIKVNPIPHITPDKEVEEILEKNLEIELEKELDKV